MCQCLAKPVMSCLKLDDDGNVAGTSNLGTNGEISRTMTSHLRPATREYGHPTSWIDRSSGTDPGRVQTGAGSGEQGSWEREAFSASVQPRDPAPQRLHLLHDLIVVRPF
jgi:hypothetical protein